MASRAADISVGANNRRLKKDLKQSEKELKQFGQRAGKGLGGAFRASLGSLAALGTAGGLASLGQEAMDFERGFTRLQIQAGEGFDAKAYRAAFGDISAGAGQSKSAVLGMANAIVNLEGAAGLSVEKLDVLTRASVATGAGMEDMAGIAFALKNAFGIEEARDMEQAFSSVIEAGKQGSVPLNEMNMVLQQQAQQFARIAETGPRGAAEFAAAVQVARKGFGSAAEVGTGMKAFIGQLDTASPKLQAFGVKVFKTAKDGSKVLRPMGEIFDQMAKSRLIKDPRLMATVFGSAEARQFLQTLIANREEFDSIVDVSARSQAVSKDSTAFLESSAGRMDKALVRIKGAFAQAFTPERIESIVDIAEKLGDVLAWVTDNVEALVAAWVAWKALNVASSLATAATAASQLAAGASGAADGLKAAGAAGSAGKFGAMAGQVLKVGGALASAATAGYALGTALDQALGLSDSIADALAGGGKPETEFEAMKRWGASDEFLRELGIVSEEETAIGRRKESEKKTFGRELTPEELEERRQQSLELSRVAGEKRQTEAGGNAATVATPEQQANMQALITQIASAVQAGLAQSTVKIDGEAIAQAAANTPSNRRTQPR